MIRTRRKQSLHVVIERIEQICEPMFILTPYQVESQNTLVVVIPKAAAGKVLENLKACNAVEATELHENPPATALFPIKLDDHRCVIHGESVHEALFVGVYGYTASSIVKTMF